MKKKTKPGAIQQLLSYAGNNKKQLYLSTFLATLGELFGMAPFITVSLLVAELFNKTATIQNVCILFAVALGGQILKLWLTYQSSFMSHKATYKILKNIRSKIADKMLRVPMGVMLDTPTGNFKNLMADTVSKLEDSMAHFMPEITSNVVAPLCCILLVFILDWRMGLAALITIPLGLLGYIGMMNDYVNKSTTYMKSQNAMNSTLVEYVNGIEVIKAFNQGSASYSKFTGAINFFHDSTLAWWKQSWLWSAVIQAVMPTTLLGTLPIGAWLYMTGTLPLSDFITCIILPIGFIAPLMRVGKYSEQFNMVKACLDQIRDFIEKPELKRPEKNVALDETAYRFENVSFAYNETEVLKNVSFEIKPGTVSAIVGPSGSGKSTIAKLMAGFWDATKGKVIFGGKNIKEIPFAQLMGEVSYVAQDNFLFDESIRENIRLGKPDATDDEVVAAAKAACCHEFIVKLKNGYDTNAGDAGGKLSGGERQRITIARAILKNARVALRFRKAIFGAPSGTRTQDPLIKSQLLSVTARTKAVVHRGSKAHKNRPGGCLQLTIACMKCQRFLTDMSCQKSQGGVPVRRRPGYILIARNDLLRLCPLHIPGCLFPAETILEHQLLNNLAGVHPHAFENISSARNACIPSSLHTIVIDTFAVIAHSLKLALKITQYKLSVLFAQFQRVSHLVKAHSSSHKLLDIFKQVCQAPFFTAFVRQFFHNAAHTAHSFVCIFVFCHLIGKNCIVHAFWICTEEIVHNRSNRIFASILSVHINDMCLVLKRCRQFPNRTVNMVERQCTLEIVVFRDEDHIRFRKIFQSFARPCNIGVHHGTVVTRPLR